MAEDETVKVTFHNGDTMRAKDDGQAVASLTQGDWALLGEEWVNPDAVRSIEQGAADLPRPPQSRSVSG